MLDAYIIDAIKQEEEERAQREDFRRARLEIPLHEPFPPPELVYRAPTANEEPGNPVTIPMVVPDIEEDAA